VDPVAIAILASWSFPPGVVVGLAAATFLYLKGFRELRAQLPGRFPAWRRTAFLAGMGTVALALVSPIDAFADLLLQVHMLQHWLLMMVAPPLLWLGAPVVPLLRGLPRSWLHRGLGPLLAWPRLQRGLRHLTQPVATWLAWSLTTLVWHLPVAYEAALRSRNWHDLEHAMFLGASLLFWYPLISPWPARVAVARPGLVLYLGAAAVFNTLFSAAFAFSNRVFYTPYLDAPRLWGIEPLADQNAAGAFLWVAASLPMLLGVVGLLVPMLDLQRERRVLEREHRRGRKGPATTSKGTDWPSLPSLGAALRSRAFRRSLQWSMLGIAAAIVVDGFFGEQEVSALNLAGVLPWTYWRGFAVIGLLVLGNVFCAVCPFTLSRSLAGRWLGQRLRWPEALDNKWPAIALFVTYLWAYEAFALWDSPFWTAWVVLGYFATCFAIEGLFPRGTFCRHVCPIGQFQFVGSGVSPLEVRRIDPARCTSCRTHDCLRGNDDAPGCPTGLFLPTKQGNLDCTFCLDCVRACPHDNAGLVAVRPGGALGVGRGRVDVAALCMVFCFGAFANAAAMIAPVLASEIALGEWLGLKSRFVPLAIGLGFSVVVAPAAAAVVCGWAGRGLGRVDMPVRVLMARLAPALVPVGLAMWLAHFGFHLATGFQTLGPAVARVASEAGLADANPMRGMAMLGMVTGPVSSALEGLQIGVLGAGLVVSIAVAWRLSLGLASRPRHAFGLALPWVFLATALYGAGAWILLQPMEMRGMSIGMPIGTSIGMSMGMPG
jgi:cytochrome c oxidase assembly factor CtaG